MKVLALVVLAGVLAVPATAAEGFRESARLQPIASAVSGRPVFVRCATSNEAWSALLAPWPQFDPLWVGGITFRENAGSHLAPWTCRQLEGWLRGKNVPTVAAFASAALLLVHETVHLRGQVDESVADCSALRELPAVLTRWFGVKRLVVRRAIMAAAWTRHRAQPPAYRTVC